MDDRGRQNLGTVFRRRLRAAASRARDILFVFLLCATLLGWIIFLAWLVKRFLLPA
jgi:flagellar biogenesis protein FliO